MKRERPHETRRLYERPHECELRVAKVQRKLGYFSCGCIVLLVVCLYLWDRGLPVIPVASAIFLLLCLSLLAHFISVLGDGFFTRGNYIVRGSYGIFEALLRLGRLLVVRILLLWIMIN
jgi:hypothetical protein